MTSNSVHSPTSFGQRFLPIIVQHGADDTLIGARHGGILVANSIRFLMAEQG